MLRISDPAPDEDSSDHCVRSLEGRLVGEWVHLLRELITQDLAQGQALILDLSGISHAGSEGVQLLKDLQAQGVRLKSCPAYLRDLCDGILPQR